MSPEYIKKVFGTRSTIIQQNEIITEVIHNCQDGSGTSISYSILPGIEIIFSSYNTTSHFEECGKLEDVLNINYCIKGRWEGQFPKRKYLYLGSGDFSICSFEHRPIATSFPMRIYEGITILLHMRNIEPEHLKLFRFFDIDIADIYERLQLQSKCYTFHATENISHVFREMYEVKNCGEINYLRLKLCEVLYFFKTISVTHKDEERYFEEVQVRKVKRMRNKLIENTQKRFNLEQLAKQYEISLSQFRIVFKEIYGETPYAYVKRYKMEQATLSIVSGGKSIKEISFDLGYRNASKFAKAFKDINGLSPEEYRRKIK